MIRVCDMIMGAGKTSAAIRMMNEDKEGKYLFITPYLDEVTRIKVSCASRGFCEPVNYGGGKMSDLKQLLKKGVNIASTHALFHNFDSEAVQLIRDAGYHLVLDEVCEVIEEVKIKKSDLEMFLRSGSVTVGDNQILQWNRSEYDGAHNNFRNQIESGRVYMTPAGLFWTLSVEVLYAFRDITILTFMFDSSYMRYLFDLYGIKFSYIFTEPCDDGYRFTAERYVPEYVRELKSLIHISEDSKLNSVGDDKYAFSVGWYDKGVVKFQKAKSRESVNEKASERIGKNLRNYFLNKMKSKSSQCIWTAFKSKKADVYTSGYASCFVPCNARATNAYRDRDKLAYCVNVFYNPCIKNFFESRGVVVDEDGYALSEMLQWIWRSAIRDRKEIWIYIPSSRMRGLLTEWLIKEEMIE